MKTWLLLASLTLVTLPLLHGAPRSKSPAPAARPAAAGSAVLPAANCGSMLVREPGRKAPRMVACSASACARNARCFTACGH